MSNLDHIEFLHVLTLDALSRSVVRADDALLFMGGTSLKLCYGSPRWSEDLDFLAVDGTCLKDVMSGVAGRVNDACMARFGKPVTVHGGNPEKNPVKFELRMAGNNKAEPHLRVKVEFHRAPRPLIELWERHDRRVRSRAVPTVSPVVSTASLTEIFAEKLHCIGGRRALKVRDVFDLAWIAGHDGSDRAVDRAAAYASAESHLALYPTKADCRASVRVGMDRLERIGDDELAAGINDFLPAALTVGAREVAQIRDTCQHELTAFEAHLCAQEAGASLTATSGLGVR
jgi:uncharacterized protein